MLTIDNKVIEEKIKQLKKAIEIVGGKSLLNEFKDNGDLANYILNSSFQGEKVIFKVMDNEYTVNELLKLKLDYEKNYIKNKKVYIEKISYKIKEYNTYLDSLIRKYRKNGGLEEFRSIKEEIDLRYCQDINNFLLNKIGKEIENSTDYYGEYLESKKEDFINSIICNIV
ncbi:MULTISPECIES: hypothetical protein [unclassified Clostridium]|uniref:hypothetical protein n=1 Tax=unclassified Clostridium TaxID=2614128 RepID=UPI00290CDA2F|nr:hypothetical protein [Clostridium sp.]MDU5107942.1 hypothetical protein [Clostridium sp.]